MASLPTLDSIVNIMYRHSDKNFCLVKYLEALNEIKKFLKDHSDEFGEKHVTLMGDFNFPQNTFRWLKTDGGIIPDFEVGAAE